MSKYIYGKNASREALLNDNVSEVIVVNSNGLEELIGIAKKHSINIAYKDYGLLNKLAGTDKHQGVVCKLKDEYRYYSLEEILDNANEEFKFPLLIMLDSLEDPHNLGAILRSADAFGADGVIIGKNRSVRLNDTVSKVSTGAIEHVKVCEVTNLVKTVEDLKKKGYWVVGAEYTDKAVRYDEIKYNTPTLLVIGSEGKGISKLLTDSCDFIAYIPMYGHVNSLNASVSCGIMLAEINKSRRG